MFMPVLPSVVLVLKKCTNIINLAGDSLTVKDKAS